MNKILVLTLLTCFTSCIGNAGDRLLNLMLITSGGGLYNSTGVEPAVDLAVQLINENNVVPGYKINVASRGDSSVSSIADMHTHTR